MSAGRRNKRMTKAELIKALEGLPDDTEFIMPHREYPDILVYLESIEIISDGSNGDSEVELIGQD